jgi:hypothetical protein
MKRAPHPVQPARRNSDGDRLFLTTVPGSNAVVSAVCGLLHQGRRGNQMKAQPYRKAGFVADLYTAKRMIHFCVRLTNGLETVRNTTSNFRSSIKNYGGHHEKKFQ